MTSAICLVNGLPTTDFAVDVAAGASITIQLADVSGVDYWDIACVDTDEKHDAEAITASIVKNDLTKTATFTMPGDGYGQTLIFQSVVNNGQDVNGLAVQAYTYNFAICVKYGELHLLAKNETVETNRAFGWIADWNAGIRAVGAASAPSLDIVLGFGNASLGHDLIMSPGDMITLNDAPVSPTDAVNKQYVDGYAYSGLTVLGDVTGTLSATTVAKIHGAPVTTIGSANTVLGTTDGTNITYFQIANAQVSSSAAIAVSKLANASALSVLGRSANSSGAHADIAGSDNQVLRISGSVLGFGSLDLATMTTASGDVSINSHKLTNVSTPTVSSDAATKGYVDGYAFSSLTILGDVTGTLAASTVSKIHGAPVTTIGASNTILGTTDGTNLTYFQLANAQVSSSAAIALSKLANGSALSVVGVSANATGAHADIAGSNNQVLRISGSVLGFGAVDMGTAQVTASADVSVNSHKITNVSTPTVSSDAATKGYVDGYGFSSLAIAGDVTGTLAASTVAKLQGRTLSSSAPTDGYAIIYNSGTSTWTVDGSHFLDLAGQYLKFGGGSAGTGNIRFKNADSIYSRNVANSADLFLAGYASDNGAYFGDPTNVITYIRSGGNIGFRPTGSGSNTAALSSTLLSMLSTNQSFGSTPATTGNIRLSNSSSSAIAARNAANTQDIIALDVNNSDEIRVGASTGANPQASNIYLINKAGSTIYFAPGGFTEYTFDATNAIFNTNNLILDGYIATSSTSPAASGAIRMANNTGLFSRNAANNGDFAVFTTNTSNEVAIGSSAAPPTNIVLQYSSGGNFDIKPGNGLEYRFTSTVANFFDNTIRMGSLGTQATDGYINFTQNAGTIISAENYDATGTQQILNLSGNSGFTDMRFGDDGSKGTNTNYYRAKSQHVFTTQGGTQTAIFNTGGLTFFPASNPSTTGIIRVGNNTSILGGRNSGNTADATLLRWGVSTTTTFTLGENTNVNEIEHRVASGGQHSLVVANGLEYSFDSAKADFKTNYLDMQSQSAPSSPSSGIRSFVDSTSNNKVEKSSNGGYTTVSFGDTHILPSYTDKQLGLSGDGATTKTLASFSLATLTQYLSNSKVMYVDVVLALFGTYSYGTCLLKVTIPIDKVSGPTYHIGSVSLSLINNCSGTANATDLFNGGYTTITVDQNSGALRVRGVMMSFGADAYAVANCWGQV